MTASRMCTISEITGNTYLIEVMSIESVEGIAPGNRYVTAGARSAPPEDVDGVPGYVDFLEQILARPIDDEGLCLLG